MGQRGGQLIGCGPVAIDSRAAAADPDVQLVWQLITTIPADCMRVAAWQTPAWAVAYHASPSDPLLESSVRVPGHVPC